MGVTRALVQEAEFARCLLRSLPAQGGLSYGKEALHLSLWPL